MVTVELVGGADDVDGVGAGRGSVGVRVDSVGADPGVVGGRNGVAGGEPPVDEFPFDVIGSGDRRCTFVVDADVAVRVGHDGPSTGGWCALRQEYRPGGLSGFGGGSQGGIADDSAGVRGAGREHRCGDMLLIEQRTRRVRVAGQGGGCGSEKCRAHGRREGQCGASFQICAPYVARERWHRRSPPS